MIPNERNATPQSTTSEDSVPLAKRRRIETPTKAKPDENTNLSASPSQDASINHVARLEVAQVHAHDQAMEDSKQNPSLDVLPIEKITITIECGNDLDTQFHIPLGLLCTQSQKQLEIFCQTEDLRNRYAKVKALRKRVNAVHPLLELHAIKHTERCREKAMTLILESLNDFPMPMYQAGVVQRLAHATDVVFRTNDLFIKPPGKKFDRLTYPKNGVEARLKLLHDEAVYTVLERLNMYLLGIKGLEKVEATKNVVRAAAQQRVLLPDEDPATVEVLVQWLYKNDISFANVNHLCRIHTLADKLGIEKLATECMALLSTATSRILRQAKNSGVTLKNLLDGCTLGGTQQKDAGVNKDPLSSCHVVGEVFKVTLKTPNPPVVLQDLVANAIAESEDDKLLSQLMPVMNLDMRGKVSMAMMRNVKAKVAAGTERETRLSHANSDASRSAFIKSEASYENDESDSSLVST